MGKQKLERDAAWWHESKECQEHVQKRLGLQQWRLLAVVCVCVCVCVVWWRSPVCMHECVRACVCVCVSCLLRFDNVPCQSFIKKKELAS